MTAGASIGAFWSDDTFAAEVRRKAGVMSARLNEIAAHHAGLVSVKGRGLMQGLAFKHETDAQATSREAFRRGLIIETGGPRDEVVKCLCPLTIEDEELHEALDILARSVDAAIAARAGRKPAAGGLHS
ncbi:MAG: hypothetical protein DIU71_06850 [Proteobacteria bacterium]|nr:MAG: hypothetical protein DIU71_06850 [Pseudomonadota bacterium]